MCHISPFNTVLQRFLLVYFEKLKILISFLQAWLDNRIDISGVQGKIVHFYGNAGVCIFKYLVTKTDPQRAFSLSILTINLVCFLVISSSYILIYQQSKGSSGNKSSHRNAQTTALQAKIAFIIFTDFLAWVPFTIICFLHFGGFVDATRLYPFFSVIVLPLNSIINPVLYNTALFNFLFNPLMSGYKHLSAQCGGVMTRFSRRKNESTQGQGDTLFATHDSRI